MRTLVSLGLITIAFGLASGLPAHAQTKVPTADIKGAADSPLLKRYQGSFIISYERHAYSDLKIPLSPLKISPIQGETDSHNNRVHRPEKVEDVEGAVTRLTYLVPAGRSPLEVLRNYKDEIEAAQGEVLFECKREGCGGDPSKATSGGGGRMSLMQNFLYEKSIKDPAFSAGNCALTQRIDDQQFLSAQVPQGGASAWVTVHTYTIVPGTYCKEIGGRTVALVHVVEPKQRERKMVLVKADEMAKAIDREGSISLYGIYFDTAKADVKPESDATLKEIATLLASKPQMTVLVVGHTDSKGAYDYNIDLSSRRANAVKVALSSRFNVDPRRLTAAGAGMMAPVATNATEEGRSKNRRVTIVQAN